MIGARAKAAVQALAQRAGYEVHPYPPADHATAALVELLRRHRIDLVLDVGANDGDYGRRLRRHGYAGRIVSFEPLAEPFARLAASSADDPLWTCRRLAIGRESGSVEMHVAANSVSSSLLPMADLHAEAAPESRYVATEQVEVATLDALWPELAAGDARIHLKIDVQGGELAALEGGPQALARAELLELELSLAPLYEGGPLMPQLVSWLDERRFRLVQVIPGLDDGRGHLLQLDGVFARVAAAQP